MKLIPLSKGLFAQVDDDIYNLLIPFKWFAKKHRNTYYAVRNITLEKNKYGTVQMHHYVAGHPLFKNQIDHADGDGLNNQRSNLKIKTHRQNQQNRLIHRNGHLPGTTFRKERNKWQATITINYKTIFLGYYLTELEAHQAYLKATGSG